MKPGVGGGVVVGAPLVVDETVVVREVVEVPVPEMVEVVVPDPDPETTWKMDTSQFSPPQI